jgi:predicted metal-dependent phosphoesterase TrpH
LNITNFDGEYARTIDALSRTGVLTLLPRAESLGVIGIDGKEYPVPTQEQVQEVFARNCELVDRKMQQGFTQLQLTPIAMPASQLVARAKTVILEHVAAGKIIQTKQHPTDVDIPIRPNTREPIWI